MKLFVSFSRTPSAGSFTLLLLHVQICCLCLICQRSIQITGQPTVVNLLRCLFLRIDVVRVNDITNFISPFIRRGRDSNLIQPILHLSYHMHIKGCSLWLVTETVIWLMTISPQIMQNVLCLGSRIGKT